MDNTEKKLDDRIEKIRMNIRQEGLSPEFKKELLQKLEYKQQRKESEITVRTRKVCTLYRKLAFVAVCFFIIVTGYSLADDFENIILRYLSNVDRITKKAIENGEVEYLNGDYIEDNGIEIKADYVIRKESDLYLAFDIKNMDKYDNIRIAEIAIKDNDGNILYTESDITSKVDVNIYYNANGIIIIKLKDLENDEKVSVVIKKLLINNSENITGNWEIY